MLQGQATLDLRGALTLAREMLHDEDRPDAVRLAAAEFIRRCTGLDRAPPPRREKPPAFAVVRQSAAELAGSSAPAAPAPSAPPAAASPAARPKRKRSEGPQSGKSLGGTREASPSEPGGVPNK